MDLRFTLVPIYFWMAVTDTVFSAETTEPCERLAAGMIAQTPPKLSESGLSLKPRPYEIDVATASASPILQDIHTVWDQSKFKTARYPLRVAAIKKKALFSRSPVPKISDLPIKFPGTDFRLPSEYQQFEETIQKMIDFEATVNPEWEKYYAYLTIDQKHVKIGEYQRGKGMHSDSIQGKRIKPKTVIEHAYTVSDFAPTAFYPQAFDLDHVDVNTHWFNPTFERQADESKKIIGNEFEIYMFDAYTVHNATPATASRLRTFVRLIFSVRIFDRLGNGHNPMFKYQWKMQPRPLPSDLIKDY